VRFLLDQSADARLRQYLSERGHDVTRVARDYRAGLPDPEVLAFAYREGRVLITHDRDFGHLVFVELQPHAGVILFRLGPAVPLTTMIARLEQVLTEHADALDQFIVVTPHVIRIRR
jgi:predicted nuclease of predicted toxin-antitoxin system